MWRIILMCLADIFLLGQTGMAIDLSRSNESSLFFDSVSGTVIAAEGVNEFPGPDKLQISELRSDGTPVDLNQSFSIFPRSSMTFPNYSLGMLSDGQVAALTATDAVAVRALDGRWDLATTTLSDLRKLCAANGQAPCLGVPIFLSAADNPLEGIGFFDPAANSVPPRFLVYDSVRRGYFRPADWVEAELARLLTTLNVVVTVAPDFSQIVRYNSGLVALLRNGQEVRSQSFTPTPGNSLVRVQAVGDSLLVLEQSSANTCSSKPDGSSSCYTDFLAWRSLPNARSFELVAKFSSSASSDPVIDELGGVWIVHDSELVFVNMMKATSEVVRNCKSGLGWARVFGPFASSRPTGEQRWARCDDDLLNLTGFGMAIVQQKLPPAAQFVRIHPGLSQDGSDQVVLAQTSSALFRFDAGVQTSVSKLSGAQTLQAKQYQWSERGQTCGVISNGRERSRVECGNNGSSREIKHPFQSVIESLVIANRTFVLAADTKFVQGERSRYQVWLQEDDGDWQLLSHAPASAKTAYLFEAGDRDAGVVYLWSDHVRIDRINGNQIATIVDRDLDAEAVIRAQGVVPVIDFHGVLYHGCFDAVVPHALCAYDAQGTLIGQVFASDTGYLQGELISGSIGTVFSTVSSNNLSKLEVFREGRTIPASDLVGELIPFASRQAFLTRIVGGNIAVTYVEFLNGFATNTFILGGSGLVSSDYKLIPFSGVQAISGTSRLYRQVWQDQNGNWIRRDSGGGGFDQFTTMVAAVRGGEEFPAGSEISVRGVADGFGTMESGTLPSSLPKWFVTQNGLVHCSDSGAYTFDASRASSSFSAGCVQVLSLPSITQAAVVTNERQKMIFVERAGGIFGSQLSTSESGSGPVAGSTPLEPVAPAGSRLLGGFVASLASPTEPAATTVSWLQGEFLATMGEQPRQFALPVPAVDMVGKYDRWLCTKNGLFVLTRDIQAKVWKHVVTEPCSTIEGQTHGLTGVSIVTALGGGQQIWRCQGDSCESLPVNGIEEGRIPQTAGVDSSGRSIVAVRRKIFAFDTNSRDWQDVTPQGQHGSQVRTSPIRIMDGWILTAEAAIKALVPADDADGILRRAVVRLRQPRVADSIFLSEPN
jgi:hypothetical protein